MGSVYTVAQANVYIKNMFAQDFLLNNISVKGEVSNCKYHSSGHIYFSIKDRSGVLSCVMFAGKRKGLNFKMGDGDKVVVSGNISVYERDGKYQLYADRIQQEGTGDLYKKYLELKEKLEEMGMFDESFKQPLKKYAMKVGIATASTGAAIQDIINISKRRNPYVELILYPVQVQGEGSAESIVNGLKYLDKMQLDVIILGRGGGSIEDLWSFNEEIVAKAIFECNTPIISAVGHETDFTIADYVADMRAPTPSAAAELAVFEYNKLVETLENYKKRLEYNMFVKLKNYRDRISQNIWKIEKMSPGNMLQSKRQYTIDLEQKLLDLLKWKINDRKHRLAINCERLSGLSPLSKISKGFAYVVDDLGQPVKSISQIKVGSEINIQFINGEAKADVKSVKDLNTRKGSSDDFNNN